MRWPFSPKIHPVLPENVEASKLPSEELDRQAGEEGLKLLGKVAETWHLSGLIREKLADGAIRELRGGRL
jgi:hypothetical protein